VRHAKAELELQRTHLSEIIAATEAAGGKSSEREKVRAHSFFSLFVPVSFLCSLFSVLCLTLLCSLSLRFTAAF
jgi:hypothetical protein